MSLLRSDRVDDPPVPVRPTASRGRVLGVGIALVMLVGGVWLARIGIEGNAEPATEAESARPPTSDSRPLAAAVVSGGKVDSVLAPGRTLEVSAADLEPGEPLSIQLGLPVPQAGDEPLQVRLMGLGRALFVTEAHLVEAGGDAGEGMRASLEIPPEWLVPGATLIEVKVRENSPLPIRRYVLRVR